MSARQSPAKGPRVLGLAIALLAAAITFASAATAGPYTAIQCAPLLGAGHGGFRFSRNSPDFHRVRACRSHGLGVIHERSRSRSRRYGMWVAEAPSGTYFTRGAVTARGTEAGGYRPRLLLGAPGQRAAHTIGSPHRRY